MTISLLNRCAPITGRALYINVSSVVLIRGHLLSAPSYLKRCAAPCPSRYTLPFLPFEESYYEIGGLITSLPGTLPFSVEVSLSHPPACDSDDVKEGRIMIMNASFTPSA